jgi:hypothetical protein
MSEYNTQPTIQTLLDEIRAGFAEINTRLERIETKIELLNKRLVEFETTLVLHDRPLYVYIGSDGCYHVGALDGPRLLPLDAGKREP